jgi:hypothetical protein
MPKDRLLSIAAAAELLDLGASTLRHGKCGTDELTRLRVGRRVMFSETALQAWIARRVRDAELIKQKQNHEALAGTRRRQWLRLAVARQEAIKRRKRRPK